MTSVSPESIAQSLLDLSQKPSKNPSDAEIDARLLVKALKSNKPNAQLLEESERRLQDRFGDDGKTAIETLRKLLSQAAST